jgi:Cys-tRNA(Pro)/Cys-tRNA(Cys) deacylase
MMGSKNKAQKSAKGMEKTNVMRLLDAHGVEYEEYTYVGTGAISGTDVAETLGQNPAQVFKTLVTRGRSGANYVFVIPVAKELDLKKAAKAAGEKSVEMVKSKELLPLTGYVHGGCSPIGMKKFFPTFFDSSAGEADPVIFSGGKIGYQVKVSLSDLAKVISFKLADLTE